MTTLLEVADAHDEAPASAGSTSLGPTYQMVTAIPPPTCGNITDRFVVDLSTWRVYAARCRVNTCNHCLPINARRRTLAMSVMRPRRMICFTQMADEGTRDPLDQARTRMKRLRQSLRRKGIPQGEWSWTLEHNPKETGYHAHAVQRGPFIKQSVLQEACDGVNIGMPFLEYIRGTPQQSAAYGLKAYGASGYGLKGFNMQSYAQEMLAINHGRVEHHTRDFFEVDGERVGVRDVEAAAVWALFPERRGPFIATDRAFLVHLSGDTQRFRDTCWQVVRDHNSSISPLRRDLRSTV